MFVTLLVLRPVIVVNAVQFMNIWSMFVIPLMSNISTSVTTVELICILVKWVCEELSCPITLKVPELANVCVNVPV